MEVDRCVCFDVTFADLKAWADEHDAKLDALQRQFGCGRGCGLCIPYIKKMLQSGRTSFPLCGSTGAEKTYHAVNDPD